MKMTPWTTAAVLVSALLVGFAAGWAVMARAGVRSPNVWVTVLILLTGSVGGPALSMRLLGPTLLSFASALTLAGFAAGSTFWPMAKAQGTQQWL